MAPVILLLLALQNEATLVSAEADKAAVRPGDVVTLSVRIRIEEPRHIYAANDPEAPAPTTIKISTLGVTAAGKIEEPKPVRLNLFGKEYDTHGGEVAFKLPVRIGRVPPGPLEIKGVLEGQACDDKNCIPIEVPFSVKVTVSGAAPAASTVSLVSAKLEPPTGAPGDLVTLKIKVRIQEGWHLYSITSDPAQTKPTMFEFADSPVEIAGKIVEPEPKMWDFAGGKHPVHEKEAEFAVPLRLGRNAKPGARIKGSLKGQACEKVCRDVEVPFEVALGAAGSSEHLDNLDKGLAEAKRLGKPVFLEFTAKT